MKRKDIADILKADPSTQFMVARYGRTEGINAESCYAVILKTADPAARTIRSSWTSHLESKPTGVEVFRADDGGYAAERKGEREVVQPQDIVATRKDWEANQQWKLDARARVAAEKADEKAVAEKALSALTLAAGVEAEVRFHQYRAPGNRYTIEISPEVAVRIAKFYNQDEGAW
jgi:hypothetical protein